MTYILTEKHEIISLKGNFKVFCRDNWMADPKSLQVVVGTIAGEMIVHEFKPDRRDLAEALIRRIGYAIANDEPLDLTHPKKYDPTYNQNRLCTCGHPYYRHFDSYDNMAPVGCKYCTSDECYEFNPAEPSQDEYNRVFNILKDLILHMEGNWFKGEHTLENFEESAKRIIEDTYSIPDCMPTWKKVAKNEERERLLKLIEGVEGWEAYYIITKALKEREEIKE